MVIQSNYIISTIGLKDIVSQIIIVSGNQYVVVKVSIIYYPLIIVTCDITC